MKVEDKFNKAVEDILREELHEFGMTGTDPYPDSDEAVAVMGRLQQAEAEGVDPTTLDLLDSGRLEL